MTHLTDNEGNSVNKADVREALDAALQSSGFASSPQLSDFLRYIVEKTIEGGADDIKAYSIAVDALGRDETFDPQDNAAVRVAAGRLRQTLALHNAGYAATNPPLLITLEAGSYVPIFVSSEGKVVVPENSGGEAVLVTPAGVPAPGDLARDLAGDLAGDLERGAVHLPEPREEPPIVLEPKRDRTGFHLPTLAVAVAAALLVSAITAYSLLWHRSPVAEVTAPETGQTAGTAPLSNTDRQLRPSISATLVLSEETYPEWFVGGEVADSVAVTMARFDSYQSSGVTVAKEPSNSTDQKADYKLQISAYNNAGPVRIFARLLRGRDGVVLWSMERLFPPPKAGEAYDTPKVVGGFLAPLLSPYGVIFNDLRSQGADRFALKCFIAAYRYFYSKSDQGHAEARDCSEELRDEGSRLPVVYAALTYLYLDEYREDRNRRDRDPLAAAGRMAARAVELGPLSARAHQAQFAVHKVQGQRRQARDSGQRAVALNPFDTDIVSDFAAWLISIGDTENGKELLDEAVSLLQSKPAWVDFFRFLGAELSRDLKDASDISALMDMNRSPLLAVAVAIGAHQRGESGKAALAIEKLRSLEPSMAGNPKAAFMRRGFDESVAKYLADKLFEAGLPRDTAAER